MKHNFFIKAGICMALLLGYSNVSGQSDGWKAAKVEQVQKKSIFIRIKESFGFNKSSKTSSAPEKKQTQSSSTVDSIQQQRPPVASYPPPKLPIATTIPAHDTTPKTMETLRRLQGDEKASNERIRRLIPNEPVQKAVTNLIDKIVSENKDKTESEIRRIFSEDKSITGRIKTVTDKLENSRAINDAIQSQILNKLLIAKQQATPFQPIQKSFSFPIKPPMEQAPKSPTQLPQQIKPLDITIKPVTEKQQPGKKTSQYVESLNKKIKEAEKKLTKALKNYEPSQALKSAESEMATFVRIHEETVSPMRKELEDLKKNKQPDNETQENIKALESIIKEADTQQKEYWEELYKDVVTAEEGPLAPNKKAKKAKAREEYLKAKKALETVNDLLEIK